MIGYNRTTEKKTLTWMVEYHCRKKHGQESLCADCKALLDYSLERVDKCPMWPDKPTCANCSTHCYKPIYREKIRQVMRFAGPRMLIYHPVEALAHLYRHLAKRG